MEYDFLAVCSDLIKLFVLMTIAVLFILFSLRDRETELSKLLGYYCPNSYRQ